jgi:hypothetical protein
MPAIGPRCDALLAELAAARGLVPASPTEITRARAARHANEPYAEVA